MLRRIVAGLSLTIVASFPATAAEPSQASIDADGTHSTTYTGGPYVAPNVSYLEGEAPVCDDSGLNDCDEMALSVTVPNDEWRVIVDVTWTPQTSDVDLEIYDAAGNLVTNSGNLPGLAEAAAFTVDAGTQDYTIRVVPYSGAVSSSEIVARLERRDSGVLGACGFSGAPTETTVVAPGVAKLMRAGGELGAFVHFSMGTLEEQDKLIADAGLMAVADFRRFSRSVFVYGPTAGFVALAKRPEVAYLQENRQLRYFGETGPWATNARVAQEAVSGGPYFDASGQILDGTGVTVSVLDSGVNATHPDFAGRVLHNYKITGDFTGAVPAAFVDVGEGDSDLTSGHGTHVAGTVLGSGARSTATYADDDSAPNVKGTFAGVAPNASLVAYSVGDVVEPVGVAPVALLLWINHGLQHLLFNLDSVEPRPRVASLSLGDGGGSDYNAGDTDSCLVNALVEAGVSVVFAAGNDGGDGQGADDNTSSFCKNPTPGVICVASYDDAGTGSKAASLSGFSSRGQQGIPSSYPDIAAPGSNITAPCTQGLQGQITCSTGAETRWAPLYGTISGTSMATPHVSGAISLLYQADPSLTPAEVEDLIQDTARKVDSNGAYEDDPQNAAGQLKFRGLVDSTAGTTNFGFGAGLLDLHAALEKLAERQVAAGLSEPTFSNQGLPDPAQVTPIVGADQDAALFGAADVLSLSMIEFVDGDDAGIEYQLQVRDATDQGVHAGGIEYMIEHFIDGQASNVAVRIVDGAAEAVDGSEATVVLSGNLLTIRVPYSALGFPRAGAPVHNIRVLSADAQTGAILDFAPSTENAPGEMANLIPAYGRPFTVLTDPTGGEPQEILPGPGVTTVARFGAQSGTTAVIGCLGCPNEGDGFGVHGFSYDLPAGSKYDAIEFEMVWTGPAVYQMTVNGPGGFSESQGAALFLPSVGGVPAGVNRYLIRIENPEPGNYRTLIQESVAAGNPFTLTVRTECPATGCADDQEEEEPEEDRCTLPGISMQSDPAGDQAAGTEHMDVLSISMAELVEATDQLTFVMDVASLEAPLPPNTNWIISFKAMDDQGTQRDLFVRMSTNNVLAAEPEFEYGFVGDSSVSQGDGNGAITGSYSVDGRIQIHVKTGVALSFSDIAATEPLFALTLSTGDLISSVGGRTAQLVGLLGTGLTRTVDSTPVDGSYTLAGNASCIVVDNTAPLASDGSASTVEGQSVEITLTATDGENDPLSFSIVSGPAKGSLGSVTGNTVTYTPNQGETGSDSFTFKANDGTEDSNVATVSISITANPDRDNDGINNEADNCPDVANADQANLDGDAFGDVCDDDVDGDGQLNDDDPCPNDSSNSCVVDRQIDAELTATPTSGTYPLNVAFDATASAYTGGGAIDGVSYTFVFGDGSDAVVNNTGTTSHTYGAAGTYKAYVIVTDENGEFGQSEIITIRTTVSVDVGNPQPTVAALKADVTSGSAPLQVTFDGSDSVAAQDTSIVEWVFKFGDGNSRTVTTASAAAAVVYTYTTPGTFRPSLTVTDSAGGTDTTEAAAVKVADASGNVPEEVAPARKGGGSLGWLILLPLMGAALRRRQLH